jgi:hypothetical protein
LAARLDQDLYLLAVQKTGARARLDQDLLLVAKASDGFLQTLPIVVAGQSTNLPLNAVRGVGWSVKKSAKYFSIPQQSTSGVSTVVILARNPEWHWEFTFEILLDNPNQPNSFYTIPFPATDIEELTSFYSSAQGAGKFAYQPPDSARGGTFVVTTVNVPTNGLVAITTDGATPVTNLKLGDILVGNSFSLATYLNRAAATVVGINPLISAFTIAVSTSGIHAPVTDNGQMVGGQPLIVTNNTCELVSTIGTVPLTITSSPSTSLTVEAVQLIDKETLTFYSNGVRLLNYTIDRTFALTGRAMYIAKGKGVSPYQGISVSFLSTPTNPVTASYNYYYLCKFSDDTQEYDNFVATLWACSSIKIQQTKH